MAGVKGMNNPTKFKKGKSGNEKGRPPKGMSFAELMRAAARDRLEQPLNKGDKQSALKTVMDKIIKEAANGDANAYKTLCQMAGAFNHEVKMTGDGVTIIYVDKEDESL